MTNHWKDLETKLVGSPTCLLLQFCLGMAPTEWKRPYEVLKDDILQRQEPKWSYKVYLDQTRLTLPACWLEWVAHGAESIIVHFWRCWSRLLAVQPVELMWVVLFTSAVLIVRESW